MKTFLDSIKERAAQAKATIAKADQLPALDAAVIETKAQNEKWRNGNYHIPNAQRDEAHNAWSDATNKAAELRRQISEAEAILRECAPYLSAHADLTAMHTTYIKAQAFKSAALSDIANLEGLITELNGEVAELNQKAKQALDVHGEASIAARLTGQQQPPTPKLLVTLSTDLESRKATLNSAETMLASAQARRDQATETVKDSGWKWRHARANVATIEYQDALASISPQITKYIAALRGINSYQRGIEFEPERAAIDAASELLDAELERVN